MQAQQFTPFSLRLPRRLIEVTSPQVMGIVNVTPDSFFEGSRTATSDAVKRRVERMMLEGADMLDIGACSTRPGAESVSAEAEAERLRIGLKALREVAPDVPVSVDTFRADVARIAVEELGADMVNDISGGLIDPHMHRTVAELKVPYILMHMRGTPADMQTRCDYPDGVTASVIDELSALVSSLELLGVADIIIDPGFGFSKTLEQNYRLMSELNLLAEAFGRPILVGISRKSMLTRDRKSVV